MKIVKGFDLDDTFVLSEMIDKMGLETDVEKITKTIQTSKLENKDDVQKIGKEILVGLGIELISKMIRNLHKAKNEVKQLVSNLTGIDIQEVGKLGFKDIKGFFTELPKQEGFEDFLSQAGELTEQK